MAISLTFGTVARDVRATVVLAAPLIGGQLALIGMNVVDVLLAGHLSAHVLGAVAVGASIWSFALIGLSGLMMAVPPTVAQLDGAGQRARAAPVFCQTLWLSGCAGIGAAVAVGLGGPLLVDALGLAPALAIDVKAFLHAVCFGAPALGVYFAARGLSEGLSVTWPTMMFGLLSLILLGPVGYVLMYGAFGLPSLGARGSGIASAIVCWAQAGAYLAFVRFAPCYPGVRWDTASWRPDWPTIRGVLRLGAPMAASLLMEASLFSVAGLMIGGLGEVAVASHQIALNVASVAFMVPLGLAMAITVRVGNAIGRGDPRAARRAGLVGIALVLLTQLCSSSVMFGAPLPIAHIYTHDAAVLAGAATLLWFAGVFQFSDGLQVAASGALRGLKDTEVPMLITGLAYWGVGMPLGWWLGLRHGFGAQGVWTGLIAGLTVAAVLLLTRFVTLSRVGVPGRRWGMRLRAES